MALFMASGKKDETDNTNEHIEVKNPNLQGADQLAIFKHDRLQLSGQSHWQTWTRGLRISSPAP